MLPDLEEIIITDRIKWSPLSWSQLAYIRDESVENALYDISGFVEPNLARGEYTLSIFLDIDKNVKNYIHTSDFLVLFITYMLDNRLIR